MDIEEKNNIKKRYKHLKKMYLLLSKKRIKGNSSSNFEILCEMDKIESEISDIRARLLVTKIEDLCPNKVLDIFNAAKNKIGGR